MHRLSQPHWRLTTYIHMFCVLSTEKVSAGKSVNPTSCGIIWVVNAVRWCGAVRIDFGGTVVKILYAVAVYQEFCRSGALLCMNLDTLVVTWHKHPPTEVISPNFQGLLCMFLYYVCWPQSSARHTWGSYSGGVASVFVSNGRLKVTYLLVNRLGDRRRIWLDYSGFTVLVLCGNPRLVVVLPASRCLNWPI